MTKEIKKLDSDDGDDEVSSKGCLLKTTSSESKKYTVYFTEDIVHTDEYFSFLEILAKAKPDDKVNILLSGFGGYSDTGVKLINHIRKCEAEVSIKIDAPVYSMHAILAFATKYPLIEDHVFFMFHDASTFHVGKNSEAVQSSVHYKHYSINLLKDICGHVLTDKEILDITEGKDLYLNGDEVKKRLRKRPKKK